MRARPSHKRRDTHPVWTAHMPGRDEGVVMDAGRALVEVTPSTAMNDGPWMIYVLLADDESIIYVGRTKNGNTRIRAHAATQSWWGEVDRVLWEPQPSRRDAILRESELIRRFMPRYNVALDGRGG